MVIDMSYADLSTKNFLYLATLTKMAARTQVLFRGAKSKSKSTDSKAGKETHVWLDMRTTEDDWDRLGELIKTGADMYIITIAYIPTFYQHVVRKEMNRRSNWKFKKDSNLVQKVIYVFGHKDTFSVRGFVRDIGMIKCLSLMHERSNPFLWIPALDGLEISVHDTSDPDSELMKAVNQETLERNAKVCNTSMELYERTKFKDTEMRLIATEKLLKASEESDSRQNAKGTAKFNSKEKPTTSEKSNVKLESKATDVSDSSNKAKAIEESDSRKRAKTTAKFNSKEKQKTTEKSDVKLESKAAELSDSSNKAKAIEESDSRKRAKAMKDSNAKMESKTTTGSERRKKAKAAEKSDRREKYRANHELKATERKTRSGKDVKMDESEVGKGTGDQGMASSRPGSRSVRTCMNCGLHEPTPKVFKKCRRCKDEGYPDPPYYCGRDCQVLDWTARHRQQHEKNAGDPATS